MEPGSSCSSLIARSLQNLAFVHEEPGFPQKGNPPAQTRREQDEAREVANQDQQTAPPAHLIRPDRAEAEASMLVRPIGRRGPFGRTMGEWDRVGLWGASLGKSLLLGCGSRPTWLRCQSPSMNSLERSSTFPEHAGGLNVLRVFLLSLVGEAKRCQAVCFLP